MQQRAGNWSRSYRRHTVWAEQACTPSSVVTGSTRDAGKWIKGTAQWEVKKGIYKAKLFTGR